MADNVTVNSVPVATREVTYSGDPAKHVQIVGLVVLSGSDDAKTATDLPGDATNGIDADVTRIVTPEDRFTSGNLSATGSVALALKGCGTALAQITGTFSAVFVFEGTLDGSTWVSLPAIHDSIFTPITGGATTGLFFIPCAGLAQVRVRVSSYTSGTVTINIQASQPPIVQYLNGGWTQISDGNKAASVIQTSNGQTALACSGDTPHDSPDDANGSYVMKMGGRAVAHGSNPTAVAASDRTHFLANRAGIPFVISGHPNVITIEAAFTGAQTDTALVTISTGSKIVVTQAQVITDNANTAFPQVRIGFGTANTPTTTGVVLTHPGVPAGGGVSRGDGSGILGIGADNEDLRITCGAPTGGSLRALVSYYTIES